MQTEKAFNPSEHLMQISKKEYLPVQWRLVWFRSLCPEGSIETEMLHIDLDRDTEEEVSVWNEPKHGYVKVIKHAKGFVIFRAVIKDGQGGIATGTKSEKAASFPDYIEKAETGAIGRALAALGYGTQFTGDELDEAHRIVDSPVNDENAPKSPRQNEPQKPTAVPNNSPATDQQRSGINRLCDLMNKQSTLSPDATFDQAGAMLRQLSTEYKNFNKAS